MRIHLFHTNDVHSQLENWMRLGARLRAMRDAVIDKGDRAFTFDIGDVLDRVRPETEATQGRINAAMMAALGYDAWVFGNNEGLTIPAAVWPTLAEDSETVVLGANMRQPNGEEFPGFRDARVLSVDGVRIGIFGLTPKYDEPYALLPVVVSDPIVAARAAVHYLQSEGCHAVMCLSHLGLREDHQLARTVDGIDVILGGHTHQFMIKPDVVGRTTIFQPGKHALAYGHTVLTFDASHRLTHVDCEPIVVDVHGALDAGMYHAFSQYEREVDIRLSKLVTSLSEPLAVRMDEESDFANVLVDSLTSHYDCDLGLMMAGCLNASLKSGEVSWRHIHGACPTPTRPVLMYLTGKQIYDIIAQGISPETYLRLGLGFGFRGGVVGWLAVSNVQVTMTRQGDRLQLEAIAIGGEPLDEGRSYRVVTCEYLWLSPVFPSFRGGHHVEVQVPLVREVLVDYMKRLSFRPSPRYQIQEIREA